MPFSFFLPFAPSKGDFDDTLLPVPVKRKKAEIYCFSIMQYRANAGNKGRWGGGSQKL
jgi:hypothetical protein